MKKTITYLTLFLLFFSGIKAQENTYHTSIQNVNFSYNGSEILITFELINQHPKIAFDIIPQPKYANGNNILTADAGFRTTNPRVSYPGSYTGNLHNLGSGKYRIVWDFRQDGVEINDDIYIRLIGRPYPKIGINNPIVNPEIGFPGDFQDKMKNEKNEKTKDIITDVIGYGLTGLSVYHSIKADTKNDDNEDKRRQQSKRNQHLAQTYGTLAQATFNYKKQNENLIQQQDDNPVRLFVIDANSNVKYINTNGTFAAPALRYMEKTISFKDVNNNNSIDATEQCRIEFVVENYGEGAASNVNVSLSEVSDIEGLSFENHQTLGNLEAGNSLLVRFQIKAAEEINDGNAVFNIEVEDENGFMMQPLELIVPVNSKPLSSMIVADYKFSSSSGAKPQKGVPLLLELAVQNNGVSESGDVLMQLQLPDNVFPIGLDTYELGNLEAGESKIISYEFLANKQYENNTIPVTIAFYGKSTSVTTLDLELDKTQTKKTIVLKPTGENTHIKLVSLVSDVDKNIPVCETKIANRYALIIGNEDYQTYQPNLKSEANVDFARNDADIFAKYAENTLAIPAENITIVTDAISTVMRREIKRLTDKAKYSNGEVELILYYSGHGFPDRTTNESYLMPVDISGADVTDGIKLNDLYRDLTEYPAKRVTVFLDACFSGGGREQGLLAAKAVKIKPKENLIEKGNLIVFSASTGAQEALVYRKMQHGIFTYHLLKKLQQTKGNLSYSALADYLELKVPFTATDTQYKEQNPDVSISPDIVDVWKDWRFR